MPGDANSLLLNLSELFKISKNNVRSPFLKVVGSELSL